MSSITALNGSSRGDVRIGVLRGGGIALAGAWRTVLRCTWCFTASSRMDMPSTRASCLIAANNSTLDPTLGPSRDHQSVSDHAPVGHFKPSQSARRVGN